MKRLIKFRGKRTDTGEWVFGDLIHGVGSKHGRMYILPATNIYPKGCNDLDGWQVTPETVGQFTGLLDKNGKEIYEGDIAKTNANEILGIIKWDGHRLCFLCEWTNMRTAGDIGYLVNNYGLGIIGSIHDNPELLRGGKP